MIDFSTIQIVDDVQLRDYQRKHKNEIYKLWQNTLKYL